MKICHLTSVHSRYDTRIYVKMCLSLSKKYDVSLIVADGKGHLIDKVKVIDVGKSKGRIRRATSTVYSIYTEALKLDADLYHLHDPELLLIAKLLKIKGKKVIFDAHEDLPKQILNKHYLNPFFAKFIAIISTYFEKVTCRNLDGIVCATPFIRNKFLKINKNVIDINNFPKLEEFANCKGVKINSEDVITYVGALTKVRGIKELIDAYSITKGKYKLEILGDFSDRNFEEKIKSSKSSKNVDFLGWQSREQVSEALSRSSLGIVTLHPVTNYLDSLPVKMFEYMAAGIPVLATNIPYWESIIKDSNCGVTVDPFNVDLFAETIDMLFSNKIQLRKYGENGKKAILEKYNWGVEESKLFEFYGEILS